MKRVQIQPRYLDLINPYYEYKLVADHSVSNISTADIAKKNYDGTNLKKILQHDKKVVVVDTNNQRREDKHFVNSGSVYNQRDSKWMPQYGH